MKIFNFKPPKTSMTLKNIIDNFKQIKSKKIGKNIFLHFGGSSYVFDTSEIKTVLPIETPSGWRVEICNGVLCRTPDTIITTENKAQAVRVSRVIYREISKSCFSWIKWPLLIILAFTVLSIIPQQQNETVFGQSPASLPVIQSQEEAFNPLTGIGRNEPNLPSTAKK